jgi:chromosome segregation protein
VDLKDYRDEIAEITKTTSDLRNELTETKDSIRSLGSVNLMAPEEFSEVEERYDFLTGQLGDLQKAKDDLIRVTAEIQKESTQLFDASFKEIKKNFHDLFRRLFGGGRAELRLADPGKRLRIRDRNVLSAPGKKTGEYCSAFRGRKIPDSSGLTLRHLPGQAEPFLYTG